jgi:hypothetical protein
MSTIWLLVLISLGPPASLPGTFATKAACESVGVIVLDGLEWACIEREKPVVQG